MKKYLGFIIITGLLLTSSLALAEDGNSGKNNDEENSGRNSGKEEVRARIKMDRDSFHASLENNRRSFLADLKSRKDEFRMFGADKKKEFWNKAKLMIGQRFEVAVNTIGNIQVRVGAMIDTLDADGKDTDAAKDYLNSSKEELADAKVKIADIKASLPTDGSQVTAEVFEKIKVDAREAKDLLKESRNDLLQAIKQIKNLRGDDDNDKEKSS